MKPVTLKIWLNSVKVYSYGNFKYYHFAKVYSCKINYFIPARFYSLKAICICCLILLHRKQERPFFRLFKGKSKIGSYKTGFDLSFWSTAVKISVTNLSFCNFMLGIVGSPLPPLFKGEMMRSLKISRKRGCEILFKN